ncbi:MAG: DUF4494 domain-containing protein [Porphyromonas sp.]|nr:DUF4494 domain-containing protein [Porphyromonas sp.]
MTNYFMCKVAYERQTEVGIKKVTEHYLVDAISCTEAEDRLIKELQPFVSLGDLDVKSIKEERFSEFIECNDSSSASNYYKARVCFIQCDETSGKETKTMHSWLINAENIQTALTGLIHEIEGGLGHFRIVSIGESPIMDVLR